MPKKDPYPFDIEVINYEVYEGERDSCLPSVSITAKERYTYRLQLNEQRQTREEYALQLGAVVLKLVNKGEYSMVTYALIADRTQLSPRDYGITNEGIVFLRDPFPKDLTAIPHKNEMGYFCAVGDPFDNFLGELVRQPAEEEVIYSASRELVLTR